MVWFAVRSRPLSSRPIDAKRRMATIGACAEIDLCQSVADEVVVGDDRGRARPLVEKSELSEHGSGSESCQSDVHVRQLQIGARGTFGDDQQFVTGTAFAKDYATCLVTGAP